MVDHISHKPNLFVIGAMKAGTSSLHEWLNQHPDIYMSNMKEPQYFAPHTTRYGAKWGIGTENPSPGDSWYLDLFSAGTNHTYRGESSVSYTASPWVDGCAERIREFNPASKLIYLLRDPIERSISHYWHFVADGREDRSMLAAFESAKKGIRFEEYISRSNYWMQLKPYYRLFRTNQIYLLTLEDLVSNPDSVFTKLFTWLGVDSKIKINTTVKHNVGSPKLKQTRKWLTSLEAKIKYSPKWRKLSELFPHSLEPIKNGLIYRTVDRRATNVKPCIDLLRPILAESVQRLENRTGVNTSSWVTFHGN